LVLLYEEIFSGRHFTHSFEEHLRFKDIVAAKKRHPTFRQWCRKRGIRSIPAVTLGFQDRKGSGITI
jgi:hypothetical protein